MSSTSSSPTESRTTSAPAPARVALLVGELAVRGRGGVNDQAPRVADIGEMAEQLDVADKRDAGLVTALEPEGEHGAGALRAIALGERMEFVARQTRIIDPGDLVDVA